MQKPASGVVSHRFGGPSWQRRLAWLPLILLGLTQLCVWFVTSVVVLSPLVVPGFSLKPLHAEIRRPSSLETALGWLLLMVYQILFCLAAISVLRTVLTPPGDIPSWLRSDGRSDLHSYSNLLQALERKKKDGSPRFCRKTSAYKPDRAHYCHEARGCVLQYQHFSLLLNTAIGFYNYKFYLLSLFYGTLSSAWVVAATMPEVLLLVQRTGSQSLLLLQLQRYAHALFSLDSGAEVVELSTLVTCALNVALLLPCAVLLCFHLHLVANGRTHYEWRQVRQGQRAASESLFDYGLVNNFALTLGVFPLLWLLPVRAGIEGNGIFFPEKHHAAQHLR